LVGHALAVWKVFQIGEKAAADWGDETMAGYPELDYVPHAVLTPRAIRDIQVYQQQRGKTACVFLKREPMPNSITSLHRAAIS